MVEDNRGNLYGTTYYGGEYGDGTVFELPYDTSTATYGGPVTLVSFNGQDGANPYGSLYLDGSMVFGTTTAGTAFAVPINGNYLINLGGLPGPSYSGLTSDAAGNLFGTTAGGGTYGNGAVFELEASQGFQAVTVASFNGNDGADPTGNLVLDGNGDIFGTTEFGGPGFGTGDGPGGYGVVFEVPFSNNPSPDQPPYDVALFDNYNTGANPLGGVVADAAGNLYGTTSTGALGFGTVFEVQNGTSTITTVATFDDGSNGANPSGPLTIIGGALFGTTYYGPNGGTVFEVSDGTIKTLGTFNGNSSNIGSYPAAGLYGLYPLAAPLIDSSGDLFGVAGYGGSNGDGTVYSIALGAYNQTIEAIGGTGPLTFSTTASSLPPGLVLSSTGVLSGIPTASGSYTFTVTVTDALGNSVSMTYTFNVGF